MNVYVIIQNGKQHNTVYTSITGLCKAFTEIKETLLRRALKANNSFALSTQQQNVFIITRCTIQKFSRDKNNHKESKTGKNKPTEY